MKTFTKTLLLGLLASACGVEPAEPVTVDRVDVGLTDGGEIGTTIVVTLPRELGATDPDVDPMSPMSGEASATDPDVDPMTPLGVVGSTDPDVDPMDEEPRSLAVRCTDDRGTGASDASFDVVVYVSRPDHRMLRRTPTVRCSMQFTDGLPQVRVIDLD